MRDLIRLHARTAAIGGALGVLFTAMLLWFNIAGLGIVVLEAKMGWLVALAIWLPAGVMCAVVQSLISTVRTSDDDEGPRGGRGAPDPELLRIAIRVKDERRPGPRDRR
ncbi:hypothetical protein FGG78_22650 [Thioclava sp. BHET1]|nr:hypothetical protein FGG78_22650 [Thioclava sp. BHET1]